MLGPRLPALSHHFGLLPKDLDELTMTEIRYYLAALEQIEKENN